MRFRDFVWFELDIQRRAIFGVWEMAKRHFWFESLLFVAGALSAGILGPWEKFQEVAGVAALGGMLTLVVLALLVYCLRLMVIPTQLYTEQQDELARYVPVGRGEVAPRGLLDFACDLGSGRSAKRMTSQANRLALEMDQVTAYANSVSRRLVSGDPCKTRVLAMRFGRKLSFTARKLRRIHKAFKVSVEDFSEAASGYYAPDVVSSLPTSEREGLARSMEGLHDAIGTAIKGVTSLHEGTGGIKNLQQRLWTGGGQLQAVLSDIVNTMKKGQAAVGRVLSTLQG